MAGFIQISDNENKINKISVIPMKKNQYPTHPILIVDDEKNALESFELTIRAIGFNNIIRCQDSRDAISILSSETIELVLLDLIMPHVSGEEILNRIHAEYPDLPVIIITGVDELNKAVECMREGAFDYLVKPVTKERLSSSIRLACNLSNLRRENESLTRRFFSDQLENPEAFSEILTTSRAMHSIFQYCEAISSSNQPILITGETGVGKELIATALHRLNRSEGEFVAVNISGLDDHMVNDTLFGHVKGAFTGADSARKGLIEKASGGTLFLDEIGDLSPASQVKLLRLLQEREYYPMGSDMPKPTDAHILVGTHRNLEKFKNSGGFRQDLFYRLKAHHVHVPPLRDRLEDIQILLEHFLRMASRDLNKKTPSYSPELLTLLNTYSYPGNIRELRAMVYDAVSQHKGKMMSCSVFKKAINGYRTKTLSGTIDNPVSRQNGWISNLQELPSIKEITKQIILEAMKRADNNQSIAAQLLGISHQALNKRLKRMNWDDALA